MLLLLFASTANAVWVSPDSHYPESEVHWNNCNNAYDGNIETYTDESEWPPYYYPLDLMFSPAIEATEFRIIASNYYEPLISNPSIEVFLFNGEFCILHFVGNNIPQNEWVDYPLGGTQFVSSARIISQTTEYTLRIYEFQINEIPEPATILLLICGSVLALGRSRSIIRDS